MAQIVLSTVGAAVAGPLGGAIGAMAGGQLDAMALNALTPPRPRGPRLQGLQLQGTAEGAPIPAAFGRARLAGTVIWAARFRERRETHGGGKTPRTVDHAYSLSFAVGLCEGPIDGIGRVWADGKPLALDGVAMRVHLGDENQAPDALIEAVEGAAPAYRGLAYVVFEDLPLAAFGNRLPQLSFEVFRRPPGGSGLEARLEGVCLIPGAGEFAYAPAPVLRREGLTRTRAENVNNLEGRPDLMVSLDQLQAQLPAVKRVTLVVTWFGDDLRCGECRVRPGVERSAKTTLPDSWRVAGQGRSDAHVVSAADGGPAYGGTPSDASVLAAIAELKRRGLEVTLLPFLMMDIPAGSGRPDPYGATEQASHPWRGRITCHPAPGRPGSPDGTAAARDQVAAFFGQAAAADFGTADGEVTYSGPEEWSWRRMTLHYARLGALAGVDGFVIGSELRGLTWVRDEAGHPAVGALCALAGDCREVLGPEVTLTYAADWSEWFGHQPADGSGDVLFHLDPLWAHPAISCVGIDWYPPLADWRVGGDHLDAQAGWAGPHDRAYLAAGVTGGESFDWFYATEAARAVQTRTPIADGAHGEDWVFRCKDLVGWWSNPHHDRPGGVRSPTPTAWIPTSKPIRLIEFGCAAVDLGANAPNLFQDAKSAESALPPFSSGARDDLMQRRALEAVLDHFGAPTGNPVSPVYAGPMLEAMDAWCWDARPYPDFPARSEVWSDADNWTTGHWLNGRCTGEAADLIRALAARGGVAEDQLDLSGVSGAVEGYVVDRPMSVAAALAPLLLSLDLETAERGGRVVFLGPEGPVAELGGADLALPNGRPPERDSRELEPAPDMVRARFIDGAADYRTGAVVARRESEAGGGGESVDLPLVTTAAAAEATAARIVMRLEDARAQVRAYLAPLAALRLEPGDDLRLPDRTGVWRVRRIDRDERPSVVLEPRRGLVPAGGPVDWRPGEPPPTPGRPWLALLDLPALGGEDDRPLAAAASDPWLPLSLHGGSSPESLSVRARIERSAGVGVLESDLPPGASARWDEAARPVLRLEGRTPASASALAVLGGTNTLAVMSEAGEWEVLRFRSAEPVGPDLWRLSGLLRGLGGGEAAARAGAAAGATAVMLDEALQRVEIGEAERGLPLLWRAAPAGAPPGGPHSVEQAWTWRGLARRPWSPAHLRARRSAGGDLSLSWIRRARLHGDGWEHEPPLGEERELYRVEVVAGEAVLAAWEVASSDWIWPAAQQVADLPDGLPPEARLRVAQVSALWGPGAWAEVAAPA